MNIALTRRSGALLTFVTLLAASASLQAAVTLNFNSGTDGFTAGADATGVAWSSYNGGSLAVNITNGWKPAAAFLDVRAHATLLPEFELALANGGTLSYTLYVQPAELLGSAPGWFETIFIGNSNGVWDQQFGPARGQIGQYGAPAGLITHTVTYPIAVGAAADDTIAQFSNPSGWHQINIGVNSGSDPAGFLGGRFYIDNFSIAANPVPETGAASLAALAGMTGLLRRRRSRR